MSLTEVVPGSGVYIDDEGRFLVGGTTPLNTTNTAGNISVPAVASVYGTFAAHAVGGEHRISNDWESDNVLRVQNHHVGGYSAIAFNAPGAGGNERAAIGVSPGHADFGVRGTLYQECSNFDDLSKYGVYRGVQTKIGTAHTAVREEWSENGDLVWYDRSIPRRAILTLKANGDVLFGSGLLPTDATSGFACLPTCRGKPTGTPEQLFLGRSPFLYDELNDVLWVYNKRQAEWRGSDMPYPLLAERNAYVEEFDPSDIFDVAYLIADPGYCFSDDSGTATCGEGDEVLCWIATNGRRFTATAASGFTLEKVDGRWVVRADGSGYLRALTGGLLMQDAFTQTAIVKSASVGDRMITCFGSEIGASRRAQWLRNGTHNYSFNGLVADLPGNVAVDEWSSGLTTVDDESEIKLYVDGVFDTFGSPSPNPFNTYAGDTITIGANGLGGERFIGDYARIGFRVGVINETQRAAYVAYAAAVVAALEAAVIGSP